MFDTCKTRRGESPLKVDGSSAALERKSIDHFPLGIRVEENLLTFSNNRFLLMITTFLSFQKNMIASVFCLPLRIVLENEVNFSEGEVKTLNPSRRRD